MIYKFLPCSILAELALLVNFSFIQASSEAPFQVYCYPEALSTQHGYCVGVSRRSARGNCEWRTCPRSLSSG